MNWDGSCNIVIKHEAMLTIPVNTANGLWVYSTNN